MGKVTFVVDFGDAECPPVSAATDIFGGRLTAISWGDYRDAFFTDEQVDVVRAAFDDTVLNNVEEKKKNAIINKMEMMML